MAEPTLHDFEYVVIHGVSPAAYERVLEAVGHCHLRHTYDRGNLEIRRILYAVDPEAYRKLIEAIPESYLRHTYDGWTLEMMTPGRNHEWVKGLLGRMIEAAALTLDIPIQSTGSTTLSTGLYAQGLQPDVTDADIARFLEQRRAKDENSVVRAFVDWARDAYSQP